MTVEIRNESGAEADEKGLATLADFMLAEMGVHPLAELSVLLVDVTAMTELHERWMEEPGPTDVLAFPMDELPVGGTNPAGREDDPPGGGLHLGDVVLCPQVAAAQAKDAGHATHDELELLCTHGILHLLGYDHADAAEHAEMFDLQASLLQRWRADGPDEP